MCYLPNLKIEANNDLSSFIYNISLCTVTARICTI